MSDEIETSRLVSPCVTATVVPDIPVGEPATVIVAAPLDLEARVKRLEGIVKHVVTLLAAQVGDPIATDGVSLVSEL